MALVEALVFGRTIPHAAANTAWGQERLDIMKVTGSIRAIKALATVLALSAFALMGTSCTACTKDGEADTTGAMESTILTTETTTPITGPDGTTDTNSDTRGDATDTNRGWIEETTSVNEETSARIRRMF